MGSDDSEVVQARDAMYALNNATLQQSIDQLKESYVGFTDEAASATESLTQAILENVEATKAFELMNNSEAITKLVESLSKVSGTYTDSNGDSVIASAAEILDSDDRSFQERIRAFEELKAVVVSLGDPALTQAFSDTNIQ